MSEGVFQYTFPAKLRYLEFYSFSSTSSTMLAWLVGKKRFFSAVSTDDIMAKYIPLPASLSNGYSSGGSFEWVDDTTLNLGR